jgi:nucleotidyltransferase substrate binding protein (TIGR01987 family)
MSSDTLDFTSLRNAVAQLAEAIDFWQAQPDGSALKPHLRSAVIQSFELSYELSIRMLRRVLIARAEAADLVADLSFNELLRRAADAGLLSDVLAWRQWREMRNATSHAYNEARAIEVATGAMRFVPDATALLTALIEAGSE